MATPDEQISRDTQRWKILARLRKGPATTDDLVEIAPRFSARLWELYHKHGIPYKRTSGPGRNFTYQLE